VAEDFTIIRKNPSGNQHIFFQEEIQSFIGVTIEAHHTFQLMSEPCPPS